MREFSTVNPATEQMIRQWVYMNEQEVSTKIHLAHQAFLSHKKSSIHERAALLHEVARLLDDRKDEYARLMAIEMGKPLSMGKSEIGKCAWVCRHYAEFGDQYLAMREIEVTEGRAHLIYEPMGAILAIMPWNFPFWQVFRFLAPAIMAGNSALIKHAANTTGCGEAIVSLFADANAHDNLVSQLIIDNDTTSSIIANPLIAGVTLTGSERAGMSVAAMAGRHIKKVVLELGGNDPYLVLDDADIEQAARWISLSRFSNAGQVCIAAKRVIVDARIKDELIEAIKKHVHKLVAGNPLDELCTLGPLARADLKEHLHRQVLESISKGAVIRAEMTDIPKTGYYYPAIILDNIQPGMPAFDEELFGPVLSVCTSESDVHAIDLANQSIYGLGGAVFSKNIDRATMVAREIESGTVAINTMVQSNPFLPFGGMKCSGFGYELSAEGMHEFCYVKNILIGSTHE